MTEIILPKAEHRSLTRVVSFLSALSPHVAWRMTVEPYVRKRTDAQNAYLWGVVYAGIVTYLPGWDKNDVHEYFLGEHFGWEKQVGFGRTKLKPLRRSSRLNKQEFSDYLAFIQRRAAEHGIYVADPGEQVAA